MGLALAVLGVALAFALKNTGAVFAGAPLSGFGFGAILSALAAGRTGGRLAQALGPYCFGLAGALVLYQIPFFALGYAGAAVLTLCAAAAVSADLSRRGRSAVSGRDA